MQWGSRIRNMRIVNDFLLLTLAIWETNFQETKDWIFLNINITTARVQKI